MLGVYRMTASPTSVLLEPGAVLSIQGSVALARGARLVVGRDALLELGPDTYLNTHAAISCLEHIRVGAGSGLSWDTSVSTSTATTWSSTGSAGPYPSRYISASMSGWGAGPPSCPE